MGKTGLPPALLNQTKRTAAFQNPEFYKKQALRLSTALTPRVIGCAEDLARHIGVSRGCRTDLEQLLREHGVELVVEDPAHRRRSFERVMREVRARHITGLTATPQRRDGHHPILRFSSARFASPSTPGARQRAVPSSTN